MRDAVVEKLESISGIVEPVGAAPPRDAQVHLGPRIVWSVPLRRLLSDVVRDIAVVPRSRLERSAKRAIDIVGSAVGLVATMPLFAVLAAAVRLSSKGPAIFVQERCGLGGKPFKFYKLRTMVVDAEEQKAALAHLNEIRGPAFKIQRDPRVTRLGSFLRKSSLDELPQLWNVLKGDMSLVGPRPPTPDEVEQYSREHARRLAVPAGLTGLWQVDGRSLDSFEQWVELDLEYTRRWSLGLDLWILVKTPFAVLFARGAR